MAPSDQPGWRVGGEGAAALHAGPGIKGSSGRQKAQPWPALPPRESAAVPSKIFFLRHIPWGTASVPAAARVHVHTAAGRAPAMSGARPGDRCPPRGLDQQCPAHPPRPPACVGKCHFIPSIPSGSGRNSRQLNADLSQELSCVSLAQDASTRRGMPSPISQGTKQNPEAQRSGLPRLLQLVQSRGGTDSRALSPPASSRSTVGSELQSPPEIFIARRTKAITRQSGDMCRRHHYLPDAFSP